MKRFSVLLLLVMMISSSCKKEIIQGKGTTGTSGDLKSPEGGHITIAQGTLSAFEPYSGKYDASKAHPNSQKLSDLNGGISIHDREIGSIHRNNDVFWLGDDAGITYSGYTDEFLMLPSWSGQRDNFYLGSMIRGNSIASLDMIPLSERLGHYESRPISASISFPGKTVSSVLNPNEMTTTQFYSNLLINNGVTGLQKAAYSFVYQDFTYYDELKQIFGSNANVGALFWSSGTSTGTDTQKISKNSGLAIKFTQKNFSLDMDIPEKGELYENLNLSALDGYWPAYVSNITYGSTGVLIIESTENSTVLKNTFTKAFSILGGLASGGSNLNSTEISMINNSTMKIYFVGVNGAEAIKSIFSFDELSAFVKRGNTFTPQTPGVPISFKLKSLKDNKVINNTFKIDVPVKMIYPAFDITLNKSTNLEDLNLRFFADQALTIPVVAPARITFNIAGLNKYFVLPQDIDMGLSWGSPRLNNTLHQTYIVVGSRPIEDMPDAWRNFAGYSFFYLLKGTDYYGGNDFQGLVRSTTYSSPLSTEIMKRW